MEDKTGKCIL